MSSPQDTAHTPTSHPRTTTSVADGTGALIRWLALAVLLVAILIVGALELLLMLVR